MKNEEKLLHKAVCRFISFQYPDVIYHSDPSGLRLSMGLRVEVKAIRSDRGIPDLFIAEPRGKKAGLYLEIKTEANSPWLKKGGLSADPHVQEQAEILKRLTAKGYIALFGVGLDQCQKIINLYLKRK